MSHYRWLPSQMVCFLKCLPTLVRGTLSILQLSLNHVIYQPLSDNFTKYSHFPNDEYLFWMLYTVGVLLCCYLIVLAHYCILILLISCYHIGHKNVHCLTTTLFISVFKCLTEIDSVLSIKGANAVFVFLLSFEAGWGGHQDVRCEASRRFSRWEFLIWFL